MNRIKYLLLFCIVVLVSMASLKAILTRPQAHSNIIELISPETHSNDFVVDKDILIDDHEKPIIVVEEKKPVIVKPYISAESYTVVNLETGEKYFDFNSNKVFPIASVSKLYTALVVHHLFDLDTSIKITQSMLDSYGDAGHLVLGEKIIRDELLHAMLMESSNDAAEAFAQSFPAFLAKSPQSSSQTSSVINSTQTVISTSTYKFIQEMNGFAQEIGMNNTSFKDPSGLSSRNVSSAADLVTLSKYLYKSEKDILKISKTQEIDLGTTTDHGYHHFVNINPFAVSPDFIGGKTGRTNEAKEAMVSLFNKKVGNTTYPIVIVVLRSDFGERELNTKKLLDMFIEKMGKTTRS